MADRTDQILHVVSDPIADKNKNASGAESEVLVVSSCSNVAIAKMANKTTPSMSDYWKKSTIIKAGCFVDHTAGWLGGRLEFHVPEVDIPTVNSSTLICFESHLVVALGAPPSKFLVSIMNFLRCEMVHLNLNAIIALSYFTMLCKCWMWITPDTSLLWYFYSPTHYDKVVYSVIELSLCCIRR
jgi:hypothetical protein